jgi:hypothetical protein
MGDVAGDVAEDVFEPVEQLVESAQRDPKFRPAPISPEQIKNLVASTLTPRE